MIKKWSYKVKGGEVSEKDNEIVLEESALKSNLIIKCGMGDYISFMWHLDDDTVSLAPKHRKLRLNRVRYRIVGIIRNMRHCGMAERKLPNDL